ncbi:hypothetical protein BH23CHL2_BH23CHL2_19790 [soil metagenome]
MKKQTFQFQGFASPNYTQVPDDLFDILLPQLVGAELKALLYIIRRTFGFKKASDPISFNQFLRGIKTRAGVQLDRGCGIRNRTTLSKALQSLEHKGVIESEKGVDALGDNATTTYRLCLQAEVATRSGVVQKTDHGSPVSSPPVVQKAYRQETAVQETDTQHSRTRKGNTRQQTPETIGATLSRRSAQLQRPDGASASDREILTSYLQGIALELNDQAPLQSTVSRLLRLYQRSQLTSISVFVDVLYRAKAIARERAGSVRGGEPGARKAMPYYLAIVEDLLGLRAKDDRAHNGGT